MAKYFGGHTDIAFSKTMRSTPDHNGLSESRVASHNAHFGFRSLNKCHLNIYPFKFEPMQGAGAVMYATLRLFSGLMMPCTEIIDKHRCDKVD